MESITPASNYRGNHVYTLVNSYSNKPEKATVQDWREGFSKRGQLIGDKLPVFKVTHPQNRDQWHTERPYYLVSDSKFLTDLSGKKVVHIDLAHLNLETTRVSHAGKHCLLQPVYEAPLHLRPGETFTPGAAASYLVDEYKKKWGEQVEAEEIAAAFGATPESVRIEHRSPSSRGGEDINELEASMNSMGLGKSKGKGKRSFSR